ncbi:MAG TPA: VanZ family protein [Parasulfuritortus sp.]
MTADRSATLRYALLAYVVVIVVGSLYPFVGWRPLASWSDDFLSASMPRYITRNDVSTNLLAYLPFGYLLARYLYRPSRRRLPILLVWLTGALLSLAMESLQVLIPTRIASNLDILLNGLGALTGALLALHHTRWLRAGQAMYRWRHTWFREHGATLGLWLLVLWLLSQFALIPQPGVGWLYLNLGATNHKLSGIQLFNTPWFFSMFLELTALGTFTACLLKPGRYVGAVFLLLVTASGLKLLAWAILMKPKVMGNILSPETLAAFILALWLLLLPVVSRHRRMAAIALLGITVLGRMLVVHSPLWPSGSLLNLVGLARHVAALWPWLALAYLLTTPGPRPHPR